MKIKAAVLYEMAKARPYNQSNPLVIEEVDLSSPMQGEVLVKIHAAGLCHSDLSVIDGNRPRPMPMAIGHEAAGEVVECGSGVHQLKPGDHVVFSFVPSCGHCLPCMTGRPALCEPGASANAKGTLLSGGIRIKNRSLRYINHHLGVSAFAEFAVVSQHSLVKVIPELPYEIAALFGCAVMTGLGAVVNTAKLALGQNVLIVGLGGVGFAALLGALASGAGKVIAADINPYKRELALQFGAHAAIDASAANAVDELKNMTNGGVDIAVEFAGAVQALELAYAATRRGGITVTAGLPHPDERLQISPSLLVAEERTLKGSYLGSCIPSRDIPAFISLYQSGRLPVDKMLSHTLKLEQVNEGFERLAKGEAIRQIITFD
ncbi:MAG: zinc-dependent alcohol dehydrogenase family protein [Segetibacter sp.]